MSAASENRPKGARGESPFVAAEKNPAPAKTPAGLSPRRTPSSFAQYRLLLAKDLRRELRSREMLVSMGIYAALVIVVLGASLSFVPRGADLAEVSGGLLWTLVVFTSLLGLGRSFAAEKENGCIEGLLLAPIDRGALFLAKATANLVFLLIVELVAVPLFWFFFAGFADPAQSAPLMVAPLALGSVGIAGIGTLLSTITVNARGKDVMLALLFVPLVFPLLYACVSATTGALVGDEVFESVFFTSTALAAAYDVIMILVSWVLYDFVMSA